MAQAAQQGGQFQGARGIKRLKAASEATALNREYLKKMWTDIAKGEKYVLGYGPMELFNAMGIYLVIPVAYGSLLAAKQMYDYYQGKIEERGYFSSLSTYETLALGCVYDNNPEIAPYGGLPKPAAIVANLVGDIGLYESYQQAFDCPMFFLEDPRRQAEIPSRWWDGKMFEAPHIVDFSAKELESFVRFLEAVTGKTYSETRMREYLLRADEMCELYWKFSELANTTVPAPVTAVDCFSEVAIFETHFGQEWALEHVRRFYAEVKERVDNGIGAIPNEQVRLLWYGTPLWANLGFYNHWEESHGAIFLENIYLARGKRMILRDRSNPALAAFLKRHMRFSGNSPTAAAELAIANAKEFKVDGVILPKRGHAPDNMANSAFVAEMLEKAGIPALMLEYHPFQVTAEDDARMKAEVTQFIESLKPQKR